MERIKHHYCWIKAFPIGDQPTEPPPDTDEARQPGVSLSELKPLFESTMRVAWTMLPGSTFGGAVVPPHGGVPIPPHGGVPIPPLLEQGKFTTVTHHGPVPPPGPIPQSANMFQLERLGQELDHGGTPPPNPEAAAATDATSDHGGVPPAPQVPNALVAAAVRRQDAQVLHGGTPPPEMMFAGATFMGGWQLEHSRPDLGQVPLGYRIAIQPVLGDRVAATAWLDGPQGRLWRQDAVALALLAFAAIGEF